MPFTYSPHGNSKRNESFMPRVKSTHDDIETLTNYHDTPCVEQVPKHNPHQPPTNGCCDFAGLAESTFAPAAAAQCCRVVPGRKDCSQLEPQRTLQRIRRERAPTRGTTRPRPVTTRAGSGDQTPHSQLNQKRTLQKKKQERPFTYSSWIHKNVGWTWSSRSRESSWEKNTFGRTRGAGLSNLHTSLPERLMYPPLIIQQWAQEHWCVYSGSYFPLIDLLTTLLWTALSHEENNEVHQSR